MAARNSIETRPEKLPRLSRGAGEPVGLIFDIRRFSIHDGPGIRTTVFFKGCPLACGWCHNPEGLRHRRELMFFDERCQLCGACLAACPHGAVFQDEDGFHTREEVCRACGTCVEACPSEARQFAGRRMTVSEVVSEIEKDRVFFDESGGGVTFSGGEPFAQPRFLEALIEACHARRIHIVLETCGYTDRALLLRLGEKVNLFLFDLKLLDAVRHRTYTGVSNERILENLKALAARGKAIVIRYPVLPGVNDRGDEIQRTAEFLSAHGLTRIDLLPYHPGGIGKYRRLRMECPLPDLETPSPGELVALAESFTRAGMIVRVGG